MTMGRLQEEKPKKEQRPWPELLGIKAGDCDHCGQPSARHEISCLAQIKALASRAFTEHADALEQRDRSMLARNDVEQKLVKMTESRDSTLDLYERAKAERDDLQAQLDAIRENAEAPADPTPS